MAAVPPPAPGAKSRTARGTTGATGAAGGDAAASDCADAALAAAAGACGAATSSSSVSESGAPGAGGCRLLLLPLLLPPCLTMHSWSCCPRSRPQPLQHVRHGCRFVAGRVHRRVRTVCCTPYCGGGTCGTRSREVGPAAECWPRFSLPAPGVRTRSPFLPAPSLQGKGNQRIARAYPRLSWATPTARTRSSNV